MPLISVIVTTNDRKEFLCETIDSILSQTFTDFELIIVDNFSNYNYFELIESFNDSRILAYQNANNGVIAINRNFGIQKATGKYLAFCDDDDIWFPEKLEAQILNTLNKIDRSKILIYSNTKCFGEKVSTYDTSKKQVNSFNDFLGINQITFSTVLLSNNEIIKFSEDIELVGVEDYHLWMTLICHGYDFDFIPSTLISYRINKNSQFRVMSDLSNLKMILAAFKVIILVKPQFKYRKLVFTVLNSLGKYVIKSAFLKFKAYGLI